MMDAMVDAKDELERLRRSLEDADVALCAALDERARTVRAIAALRAEHPDLFWNAPRDNELIARAVERVRDFPASAVAPVMTEVLSACAALEAPLEVAYVGQEGDFGHVAARRQFGASAVLRAVGSAEAVLSEIERGRAAFGLLPFETSNDGAVTATVNLLARGDAKICAEIPIRRSFHLVSKSPERDTIRKVYAGPSAIAACERYLATRFPNATVIDTRNGAVAAEHAQGEPDAAAIVTELIATLSGLTVVERAVEDEADLTTRFVAVGNDYPPRTGRDRTAIALALHDGPGVLLDCLRPFADRKLNLYRLETRPARGWEFPYLILLEVDGHITDRSVLSAIDELRGASRYVKVLGSYPRVA